jgi:hypothetical protein
MVKRTKLLSLSCSSFSYIKASRLFFLDYHHHATNIFTKKSSTSPPGVLGICHINDSEKLNSKLIHFLAA